MTETRFKDAAKLVPNPIPEDEMTHFGAWSLREGKVIRVRWFGTRAEALEDTGLT